VQIDQVTKEVAESMGLGKPQGALVRAWSPVRPAEKAGVEAGDIITRFDGKTIEKASDLPRFVGSTKPGTRSTFTVFRRGAAAASPSPKKPLPASRRTARTRPSPVRRSSCWA
jgi:serine protease Do